MRISDCLIHNNYVCVYTFIRLPLTLQLSSNPLSLVMASISFSRNCALEA